MLSLCIRAWGRGASPLQAQRGACTVVDPLRLGDFGVSNEPILPYSRGSQPRIDLERELRNVACVTEVVPIVIGDECIKEGEVRYQVMPHNHQHKIAQFFYAKPETIQKAIDVSVQAQKKWDLTPMSDRLKIWDKAANLMAKECRQKLNAATMLGQSKTVIQAEIDAACELIDFFKFNIFFMKEHSKYQPISETPNDFLNSIRFRGIDGFIAAISPFNFTAIGGNLAYTPALMGNGVVWKPSDTAVLSNWRIFNIMRAAGLPPGVVNFVPADGPTFGKVMTSSPDLAGVNFTGSVPTFNWIWGAVAQGLPKYRNYPRLIGECGGKNYHFVHPSADLESAVKGTVRSAFEYCGQKCSACSRLYVPQSMWPAFERQLAHHAELLKVGDVADFSTFMGAVIDDKAYARISSHLARARTSEKNRIVTGGQCDDKVGYFIRPTVVQCCDPLDPLMTEELFGPVLAVYAYPDGELDQTLRLVGSSTRFALTGAVFAQDEAFLRRALQELKDTAGNFYINDKSTGSVVGQQPFGGGRMSGTNDKAGGPNYVMRWTTQQTIKENFKPITEIDYPYMRD